MFNSSYFCECGNHETNFYPSFENERERDEADMEFSRVRQVWRECTSTHFILVLGKNKYWGMYETIGKGLITYG